MMNKTELHKNMMSKRQRSFFATQTVQQLKSMHLRCWGVFSMKRLPCPNNYKGESGGLVIMCNPAIIPHATVLITLGWDDTYNIDFYKATTKGEVELESLSLRNVYAENLSDVIDSKIEMETPYA